MKILNRKKLITLHRTVCFLCGAEINAHTRCLVEWYGYGDHISDARHVCKTCEIMRIRADMFGKEYFDSFMKGDRFYDQSEAELERRIRENPDADAIGIVNEMMYDICCTICEWRRA